MYDNIGGKLKGLAKVLFWVEISCVIILGVLRFAATNGLSLLWMMVGLVAALISAWLLYGFGEIIEKLGEIERNIRGGERKSKAQEKADYERLNKIERLRSQGLITEEEYQQAISKEQ